MMRKYNGAISLFMVIIVLTSFIFGGVFIDASRIVVAKSKVRNAMNTALRSSMSYYDKALVGDYGLYGETEEEADKQFKKYFEVNMKIKDTNLNMFDYSIAKSEVKASVPVSDSSEFERQVVEYSKYRAPVTTTMVLIDKVTSTFKNFKASSDKISKSTDALDDFKKQFKADGNQISQGLKSAKNTLGNQVKSSVNNYKEMLKDDANYINELKQQVNDFFGDMNDEFTASGNTLDKMVSDTENYRQSAKTDLNEINSYASKLQTEDGGNDGVDSYPTVKNEKDVADQADDQAAVEGSLRKGVNALKNSINVTKGEIDALLNKMAGISSSCVSAKAQLKTLEIERDAAKSNLDEKNRVFSNMLEKYNAAKDAENNFKKASAALKTSENQLREAKEGLEENADALLYVDIYSDPSKAEDYDEKNAKTSKSNIRKRLRQEHPELKNIFNIIDSYESNIQWYNNATAAKSAAEDPNLEAAYSKAKHEKEEAQARYDSLQNQVSAKQGEISGYETEIDDISGAINNKMNNIMNAAIPQVSELKLADLAKDKIKGELEKIDIVNELKSMLDKLNRQMVVYSVNGQDGDNVDTFLDDGIINKIKSLTNYASEFFATFTNAEKLRNNAYMVDYIMDRCTYLTSQTSRNHYFEKGEVEYIIFGHKSQVSNITASIGTITVMRFVINFIDYFITGPGDLIGKAIYALGRGAAKTYLDLRTMFISDVGKGVGLCPSFDSLKLTYSDHLRLMLFFKLGQQQEGLKDTIYTNMQETLGGGNINTLSTKMQAEVEVEVNLIILPALIGQFTGSNFRNGNYVIKDRAVMHY